MVIQQNFLIDIFYKIKDEVVQILSSLDDSLQLDHTKKWVEIAPHVSKHIMKEIARALTGRFQYKDIELKWVLQNLHRHRRESWMVSLDPDKTRLEKKRKGTNSRRKDVSTEDIYNMKLKSLILFLSILITNI